MTPLIDVMLVLLVIFMLTAPLMTSNLKLNLPKTEGSQPQQPNPQALNLTILSSGELRWGDETLPDLDAFKARLQDLAGTTAKNKPGGLDKKGADTEVHLKADTVVPYGRVAEVLGLLQQAGLRRIAFATQPRVAAPAAP